jgi:hypothetical protein
LSSDRVAYNAHGRSIAAQWTPISCSGHFALMGAAHITSVAVSHMKWAGPDFPHSDNPVLQNLNENHGSGIKAKHLQSFSSSQNLSLSAVPSSNSNLWRLITTTPTATTTTPTGARWPSTTRSSSVPSSLLSARATHCPFGLVISGTAPRRRRWVSVRG